MSNNGTVNTRYSILNCTREAVERMGGENIQVAKYSGIVFADLTEMEANDLRNSGCIVEPVERVTTGVIAPPAPPPVSLQPMVTPVSVLEITGFERLRGLVTPALYGLGIKVAIIDTGMRETHQQLAGKIVYSKNFTTAPMRDGFDHGTGIASILAAVAPECSILNLKAMDDAGEGTTEAVVHAIEECIDLLDTRPEIAPSIINLSLGTEDIGDPNDILRIVCRAAIARGIWLNAAAGNVGPYAGTIMSPACERYVFATGSGVLIPRDSTFDFEVSSYSSRGPTREGLVKPDAMFFGENVQMASSESDSAVVAKSGTSFATSFMSGLAILLQQGLALSDVDARDLFLRYGEATQAASFTIKSLQMQQLIDQQLPRVTIKPSGVSRGKDNSYGYGVPFGDLVSQVVSGPPAMDLSALIGAVMVMGMMGMMMKTVTAGGNGRK